MEQTVFISHRNAFLERMKERSFSLFFSGVAPHKTGDQSYAFVVNRNFYYLTGIERENFILLLVKGKDTDHAFLFIEEPSDYATKWLGKRMTKEEAEAMSGILSTHIRYLQEFDAFLASSVLSDSRKALIQMPKALYLDLYRVKPLTKPYSLVQTESICSSYPEIKIKNANEILDELRLIKSEAEIEMISQAIAYTKGGIETLMQNARPGVNEHHLEALFDFTIRLRGSEGTAFGSIIAGGKNATILHYEENNQVVEDGKLILLDLGALAGPYAGDISRTFPVSGKFSERQKQFYELVLEVNKATMALVKPGVMVSELNQFAKEKLAAGLIAIGLIFDSSQIDNYYYHNVSHYLGLDVHDVGTYQSPLAKGVVLTIEPGLYIAEEGIGIRIEDNVLVTEDGYKNLSEDIVKEIADIERLMATNI